MIALKNGEKLLKRNCDIVDKNLPLWDVFFFKYEAIPDIIRLVRYAPSATSAHHIHPTMQAHVDLSK